MNYTVTQERLGIEPVTMFAIGTAVAGLAKSAYERHKAGQTYRDIRREAERVRKINRETERLLDQAGARSAKTEQVTGYIGKQNVSTAVAAGLVGIGALWAFLS